MPYARQSGTRDDPRLRAFHQRLRQAGKPGKVALIAAAHKLLTIIGAMLRTGQGWRAEPTAASRS